MINSFCKMQQVLNRCHFISFNAKSGKARPTGGARIDRSNSCTRQLGEGNLIHLHFQLNVTIL